MTGQTTADGLVPYYADEMVTLHHGDCLDVLATLPDNCVDAVITDPPYGLEFMGVAWDTMRDDGKPRARNEWGDFGNRGHARTQGEVAQVARRKAVAFEEFSARWAAEALRVLRPGGYVLAFGGSRTWHRLACAIEDAGFQLRDSIAWLHGQGFPKSKAQLKPAFEPIVMGRKPGPLWLNVDGCRVPTSEADKAAINAKHAGMDAEVYERPAGVSLNLSVNPMALKPAEAHPGGRWPTNVVLDQSQVVGLPPRFFPTFRFEAKAPSAERPRDGDVAHPTVKPLDLMRWLVRLVTPPGGLVLEPFAGSGTTAEACVIEGFRCIAVEREAAYLPLIVSRLTKPIQPDLFGGAA